MTTDQIQYVAPQHYVDHALASGEAERNGRNLLDGFTSARLDALRPVIADCENGEVEPKHAHVIARAVTLAYAEGLGKTYTVGSEKVQVSKSMSVINAALAGGCSSTMQRMQDIANSGDDSAKAVKGWFEKTVTIMRMVKGNDLPSDEDIRKVVSPEKPEPSTYEEAARLFAQVEKNLKAVAKLDLEIDDKWAKVQAEASVEASHYEKLTDREAKAREAKPIATETKVAA